MAEYKLPYTGPEVETKLQMIDALSVALFPNSEDIRDGAFLRFVDGKPVWQNINSASEVRF